MTEPPRSDWLPAACNLCECNCGIEIQLGGPDGRHLTRVRGNKKHPGSKGYACEKPSRLDHYQNGPDRITTPLRRGANGEFEPIDWDTAIREVGARLGSVRDRHGGESIFYFGGGGQGNHTPGAYSRSTQATLGIRYRSNALAQEKTGEFFVSGKMFGGYTRGDFQNCEVALFVGKNPWMSHGMPHARVTLREIAKDPKRSIIVIDPRKSETAEIADLHLQVRPGRDAWLLAAMLAVLVQEERIASEWLDAHADGLSELRPFLTEIDVSEYCAIAGVPEEEVREATYRIAGAESVAVAEDLGVQMNVHSTLLSYLQRLLSTLTGHFGRPGTAYLPTALQSLIGDSLESTQPDRRSPVADARIITGLVPCNVVSEEILSDHPKRYRAMIVESANPAHSLADSPRVREALSALDTLVVIDVAMTETARLADYVLPPPTQFEKAEFTLFNFEFPENYFYLRQRLLEPPDGVLPEAEIHARLVEELGAMPTEELGALREAAEAGLPEFAAAFQAFLGRHANGFQLAPVVLYRTLGETLPPELKEGAVLWGACLLCAIKYGDSVRRAGFEGEGVVLGNALFEAILEARNGLTFTSDPFEESFARVRTENGRIQLWVPEMEEALHSLRKGPEEEDQAYPFVLSAGERRSFTANTIFRDPRWRKKDAEGALFLSRDDGVKLGIADGDRVRITTKRGRAEVRAALSDRMRPGHVSIPNGLGLTATDENGSASQVGVAPNDLTSSEDRDPFAGTPWHKRVAARIEPLEVS